MSIWGGEWDKERKTSLSWQQLKGCPPPHTHTHHTPLTWQWSPCRLSKHCLAKTQGGQAREAKATFKSLNKHSLQKCRHIGKDQKWTFHKCCWKLCNILVKLWQNTGPSVAVLASHDWTAGRLADSVYERGPNGWWGIIRGNDISSAHLALHIHIACPARKRKKWTDNPDKI